MVLLPEGPVLSDGPGFSLVQFGISFVSVSLCAGLTLFQLSL